MSAAGSVAPALEQAGTPAAVGGVSQRGGALVWVAVLLFVAWLAVDSAARVASLRDITGAGLDLRGAPQPDAGSPTGLDGSRHRLLLHGPDSYQWILQTEAMLAQGRLRVRETHQDNAPYGREVHWAVPLRWWLAGTAWLYQRGSPRLSLPLSVETVVPWANTLLVALLLLALVPFVMRRFGPVAAALLPVAAIATYPVYHYFAAGDYDHHGVAAVAAVASVLLLAAGVATAGAAGPAPGAGGDATARRCFIVSAATGAAGLWISASTLVPVLVGLGLAALLLVGGNARAGAADAASGAGTLHGPAPELWRLWGVTGCVASLLLYLLEYFPAHVGMRLEVNQPLYALAWLGAGNALYRLGSGRLRTLGERAQVAASLAAVAALPAAILIGRGTVFLPLDPLLWALHEDYISEFRGAFAHFAGFGGWQLLQVASALPLLALPAAALLWHAAGPRPRSTSPGPAWWAARGAALAVLLVGLAFTQALAAAWAGELLGGAARQPQPAAVQLVGLLITAACLVAFFLWPLRRGLPLLPLPWRAALAVAVLPASLVLALSLDQIRWLGTASALWIGALVVMAGAVRAVPGTARAPLHRRVAIAILLLALVPFPAFTALVHWRHGYPGTRAELRQLVARDVAYTLRNRLGTEPGVVLSDPTSTMWMMYFGGLRGVATLYWENVEGLHAAAAVYGARTDEDARRIVEERGITHLVLYSWNLFALEYARLHRGQRLDPRRPDEEPADAFIVRLLRADEPPPWLNPVPYTMPTARGLEGEGVLVFEVTGS